ncbi:hypothetical protein [Streptomyces sp. T12]|nr:hypothetical protein [Streptomyces sp. T12]TWD17715.1 hypothetical protein FB570_111328 [Streptomyces sp. T12]
MGSVSTPTQLLGWAWPLVTIKIVPDWLPLTASTAQVIGAQQNPCM